MLKIQEMGAMHRHGLGFFFKSFEYAYKWTL